MKTISISQWVAAMAKTESGVHAASSSKLREAAKLMRIPLAMRELKRPEGRAPMGCLNLNGIASSRPGFASPKNERVMAARANQRHNPVGVGNCFTPLPKVAPTDRGNLGLKDAIPLGLKAWRFAILYPWLASVIILLGVSITSAQVNLPIGNLAPGESVTLTFDVTVTNPFPANINAVTNQGTLTGNNFTVNSDDPQTSAIGDATVTLIEVPPTVLTQAATLVTPTSATLNSLVNPNGLATAAFFQFGLTTGYGDLSATNNFGGGTTPLASAATLTNLAPGTLYHYRVVATNNAGTNAGGDLFFTTIAIPPPLLAGLAKTNGGPFQFTFTNTTGQTFTVVATTNLALPFSNWIVLGTATEGPAGQFKFSDAQATNSTSKFYRVRWP